MSDPGDSAPRPQYGEYASPEEQRARIRQPDATHAIDASHAPAVAPVVEPSAGGGPAAQARGRGRLADRIITIVLLAYGLLSVVSSVPLMFALAEGERGYLGLLGMTEPLSDRTAAQVWGAIAGSVFLIGWLVTAWLSWASLRRGRITFWIPLVGALVTSAITSVLIFFPALGDPVFVSFIQEFSRNPTIP